jgi:hypothetical protein
LALEHADHGGDAATSRTVIVICAIVVVEIIVPGGRAGARAAGARWRSRQQTERTRTGDRTHTRECRRTGSRRRSGGTRGGAWRANPREQSATGGSAAAGDVGTRTRESPAADKNTSAKINAAVVAAVTIAATAATTAEGSCEHCIAVALVAGFVVAVVPGAPAAAATGNGRKRVRTGGSKWSDGIVSSATAAGHSRERWRRKHGQSGTAARTRRRAIAAAASTGAAAAVTVTDAVSMTATVAEAAAVARRRSCKLVRRARCSVR